MSSFGVAHVVALASMLSAAAGYRVTACKGQPHLVFSCPSDERISVKSVSYAYDPKPCDSPTDQNDCTSQSLILSNAAAALCNGQSSCSIPYRNPTDSADIASELRDPSQCQIGSTFYTSQDLMFNYKSIVYDCKAYEFCKEEPGDRSKSIVVKTSGYPAPTARTNPSCSCEFASDDRSIQGLMLSASCPGSNVTFRLQRRALFGEGSMLDPSAVTEVHCFNATVNSLIDLPPLVQQGSAISVWADEDKSDERSAYSVVVLATKHSGEFDISSAVNVSCKAGGIFLTKTERLVIASTVPVGIVIFIALIVICKVVKHRSKLAAKRRKAVPNKLTSTAAAQVEQAPEKPINGRATNRLDGPEMERLLHVQSATNPKPKSSPAVVAVASAPQPPGKQPSKLVKHVIEQIRSDPEGEDLVQFATLLHKRRLIQEEEEAASVHSSFGGGGSRPGSRPVSMAYASDFRPNLSSIGRRPSGLSSAPPPPPPPSLQQVPPGAAAQIDDGSRMPASQVAQPPAAAAQPEARLSSGKRMPAPPPPPVALRQATFVPVAQAAAPAVASSSGRPQQLPPSVPSGRPQPPPKPSKLASAAAAVAERSLPHGDAASLSPVSPASRAPSCSQEGPPKPARLHSRPSDAAGR